jgi:hypothetical protein
MNLKANAFRKQAVSRRYFCQWIQSYITSVRLSETPTTSDIKGTILSSQMGQRAGSTPHVEFPPKLNSAGAASIEKTADISMAAGMYPAS